MHPNQRGAMREDATHVTVGATGWRGGGAARRRPHEDAQPCLFHSAEVGTAYVVARVYRSSSWPFQAGILESQSRRRNRGAAACRSPVLSTGRKAAASRKAVLAFSNAEFRPESGVARSIAVPLTTSPPGRPLDRPIRKNSGELLRAHFYLSVCLSTCGIDGPHCPRESVLSAAECDRSAVQYLNCRPASAKIYSFSLFSAGTLEPRIPCAFVVDATCWSSGKHVRAEWRRNWDLSRLRECNTLWKV